MSTITHGVEGLAKMRLKNSYSRLCAPFDSNYFPGINARDTKQTKFRRMSDIVFDFTLDGNPMSLRFREQHNLGPYQVIKANQLLFRH